MPGGLRSQAFIRGHDFFTVAVHFDPCAVRSIGVDNHHHPRAHTRPCNMFSTMHGYAACWAVSAPCHTLEGRQAGRCPGHGMLVSKRSSAWREDPPPWGLCRKQRSSQGTWRAAACSQSTATIQGSWTWHASHSLQQTALPAAIPCHQGSDTGRSESRQMERVHLVSDVKQSTEGCSWLPWEWP